VSSRLAEVACNSSVGQVSLPEAERKQLGVVRHAFCLGILWVALRNGVDIAISYATA
jgi:hypothetical protein